MSDWEGEGGGCSCAYVESFFVSDGDVSRWVVVSDLACIDGGSDGEGEVINACVEDSAFGTIISGVVE